MVYKVSSCFFFMVRFLFLIVAQLELGPTPSVSCTVKKKACNAHQIWCATFVPSGTPYMV